MEQCINCKRMVKDDQIYGDNDDKCFYCIGGIKMEETAKIYVNTTRGLAEYMGGPNFLDGKRKCPDCKGEMERSPLRQQFVRVEGGKVLVDIKQDGTMIVSKADPDWNWFCKKCVLGINPSLIM